MSSTITTTPRCDWGCLRGKGKRRVIISGRPMRNKGLKKEGDELRARRIRNSRGRKRQNALYFTVANAQGHIGSPSPLSLSVEPARKVLWRSNRPKGETVDRVGSVVLISNHACPTTSSPFHSSSRSELQIAPYKEFMRPGDEYGATLKA